MSEIQKWSDKAMFEAAPIKREDDSGISVSLLWMTPDPLGAIAAACRMYEGLPTYNLNDITDEEREKYWEQVQKTHLKAPLEFVKFHFFIEGVDRAFTHQMVRQRTAVYAQESMRFAVKNQLADEVAYPPSLMDDSIANESARNLWDAAVQNIEDTYNALVNSGVPAEDARGLLPHATPTRLNYCTDLRALMDHAGNRLCTQAQFHWRIVFLKIVKAIQEYGQGSIGSAWQFELLSKNFKPVCYEKGHCPFMASFDRGCTIRDRVEAFSAHGIKSEHWHEGLTVEVGDEEGVKEEPIILPIHTEEWLMDPRAAWVK